MSDTLPRSRIAADQPAAILRILASRPKTDHVRLLAERADYAIRALLIAIEDETTPPAPT